MKCKNLIVKKNCRHLPTKCCSDLLAMYHMLNLPHKKVAPTSPAVGQSPPDGLHVPVFIPGLLQQLDPHVRNGHSHAVVEPDSTFIHRPVCTKNKGRVKLNLTQIYNN